MIFCVPFPLPCVLGAKKELVCPSVHYAFSTTLRAFVHRVAIIGSRPLPPPTYWPKPLPSSYRFVSGKFYLHGTTGIWGVSGALGVSPTVVDPCNGAGCIFDAGSLTATTLMGKSLVYLLFLGFRSLFSEKKSLWNRRYYGEL